MNKYLVKRKKQYNPGRRNYFLTAYEGEINPISWNSLPIIRLKYRKLKVFTKTEAENLIKSLEELEKKGGHGHRHYYEIVKM